METFKSDNKEVEFWNYTGEVVGQGKFSETHISTSQGYVGIDAVTNQEIWIKREDGSERSVQLTGHNIPIREGQKVSLIYAGIKGEDFGCLSVLVNHNAKKHWIINDAKSVTKTLKVFPYSELIDNILGISGLIIIVSFFIDVIFGISILILAGVIVFPFQKKLNIHDISVKFNKSLDNHLKNIAQEIY